MQLLQHFKELTIRPKNAEELNGLILQLAIQGKLTANWREGNTDIEPASELLNRIQKEKAKLVKEKKIKKEKPLLPITEDEISCQLPKSWVWKRLGEIVILKSGTTFNKSLEEITGDYMYVKVGAMNLPGNENIITTSNLFVNSNDKIDKSLIPKRSIIFPKRGGAIATNKKRIVKEPILVDLNTMAIISPEAFNFMYLKYWFDSIDLWSLNNGTSVPQINNKDIAPLVFPIPPLEEQKEIVNVVETLFKEVEQLEQLTVQRIGLKEDFVTSALHQLTTNNATQEWTFLQKHFKSFFNEPTNIKKLRETVLQLAVQGKLTEDWRANNSDNEHASILLKRIQEEKAQLIKDKKIKKEKALPTITKDEFPYELPDGWVWCRMGEIAEKLGAGSTPSGGKSAYVDEGVMFFRSQNIYNTYLKLDQVAYITDVIHEKMKGTKVRPKDILLNITGGSIGRCSLISDDFDTANVSQHVAIVRMIELETRKYIHQFITSKGFQDRIMDVQVGVSREGLSMTKLKMFPTPLPPLEEQKAIVEKVNALMDLCDALEEEVQQSQAHSEQLMQSVLREVFDK